VGTFEALEPTRTQTTWPLPAVAQTDALATALAVEGAEATITGDDEDRVVLADGELTPRASPEAALVAGWLWLALAEPEPVADAELLATPLAHSVGTLVASVVAVTVGQIVVTVLVAVAVAVAVSELVAVAVGVTVTVTVGVGTTLPVGSGTVALAEPSLGFGWVSVGEGVAVAVAVAVGVEVVDAEELLDFLAEALELVEAVLEELVVVDVVALVLAASELCVSLDAADEADWLCP
jgi:hypothetical protein